MCINCIYIRSITFDLSLNETQEKIIKEIKWHVNKVYNILNYSIRERNFKGRRNENYNKSRKIKKDILKTNSGKIINLRLNGALNILRKYIKEILVKSRNSDGYWSKSNEL